MKKRKWYSSYGQVMERPNLVAAFQKVKANGGDIRWVGVTSHSCVAKGLMKQILEGELDLTVHPEKTRIVPVSKGFEFLGWHVIKARTRSAVSPFARKPNRSGIGVFRRTV